MRQPSTLDLRPSARTSLPSSSSLSVRGPLHTLSRSPPAPTSPTGTHHHPVRTVVLSLFPSVGQVRLSGPSHSPYPCPQPCPRPRCLSNLTLANPSTATYPPPPSCTAVIPSFSISLSLFLSRTTSTYHFYALAVWMHHRANSYAKLPMVRYLPTYLPSYLPSWLATYSRKTRWGCKLRITVDIN